jgi:isopenicillin-N epimerase
MELSFQKYWLIDPAITFLNHGSFGACPIPVLETQQQLRNQLESQPLQFFNHAFEPLLDAARQQLAAFVGVEPQGLAFVPNATTGVNAVLRSLAFQPGDQLLTTNHEYNACRNALNYVAERAGIQVRVAEIPFPIESSDQVIKAVLEQVTPQTRLALLDHVTSQTGLILPIAELVQKLGALGIETLVDGAHAPGMVPLDLSSLGATYYTGNCHKWLCAPKGAAFLYVRADRRDQIRPLTISHGANATRSDRSRFWLEFDWMGTDDPTAYLSVPKAIEFMGSLLPGGWPELMTRNHQLAISGRQILCERLGILPPCSNDLIGSLAVLPLPSTLALKLQQTLWNQYFIEVPVFDWNQPPSQYIRISAQIYNYLEQYSYLAGTLETLLSSGR